MDKQRMAKELYNSANENGFIETLEAVFGKNFAVRMRFTERVYKASIDDLDFSVRSSNALKRSGLMTVEDVVDAIATERLMTIRNLGRKSFIEIKTRILKFGYDNLSDSGKISFFYDLIERNSY